MSKWNFGRKVGGPSLETLKSRNRVGETEQTDTILFDSVDIKCVRKIRRKNKTGEHYFRFKYRYRLLSEKVKTRSSLKSW